MNDELNHIDSMMMRKGFKLIKKTPLDPSHAATMQSRRARVGFISLTGHKRLTRNPCVCCKI